MNILFLQGPVGSFFQELGTFFEKKHNNCHYISLNAGDSLFYKSSIEFKEDFCKWKSFVRDFYIENDIEFLLLTGDERKYHKVAIKEAKKLNIKVVVFEYGYFRPYYITMELDGVNANSNYLTAKSRTGIKFKGKKINNSYLKMHLETALYYFSLHYKNQRFKNYIHHRETNSIQEFNNWLINIYRKIKYKYKEKISKIKEDKALKKSGYYLVAIQTHNDFQLRAHSDFDSIEDFLKKVIKDFSEIKTETMLFFKHHPVDRGRRDFKDLIEEEAAKYGLSDRIRVGYDISLPYLIKNSQGMITINSSSGISSLINKRKVFTYGNSIYDELIEKTTLEHFILNIDNEKIDWSKVSKALKKIKKNTQVPGSFYSFDNKLEKSVTMNNIYKMLKRI